MIPRLNPDAPPFIPRFSVLLSSTPALVPAPAAEVRLPSVSESHVDKAQSAIKYEDERLVTAVPDFNRLKSCAHHSACDVVHSSWPAETKDADDIALLMYFGLLDLVLP
jgi:hypothetical protein